MDRLQLVAVLLFVLFAIVLILLYDSLSLVVSGVKALDC